MEGPPPGSDAFSSEWAPEHLPSYGPDWERAIAFGVDVTLLLENLALTPTERLLRLQQAADFHALLRDAMDRSRDARFEAALRESAAAVAKTDV